MSVSDDDTICLGQSKILTAIPTPANPNLIFNSNFNNRRHVYHLLTAYVRPSKLFNRDLLIKRLYFHYGIQCIVQYYPLYKYPLFKNKGLGGANCQNTENFYMNMISFPFHIWMSKKELNYMIRSVIKTVKELSNKIE